MMRSLESCLHILICQVRDQKLGEEGTSQRSHWDFRIHRTYNWSFLNTFGSRISNFLSPQRGLFKDLVRGNSIVLENCGLEFWLYFFLTQ